MHGIAGGMQEFGVMSSILSWAGVSGVEGRSCSTPGEASVGLLAGQGSAPSQALCLGAVNDTPSQISDDCVQISHLSLYKAGFRWLPSASWRPCRDWSSCIGFWKVLMVSCWSQFEAQAGTCLGAAKNLHKVVIKIP